MEEDETKLKNRGMLLNFAVEEMGSPGIVVNPDIARATPCRCYVIDAETKMCFSKGIIGTLSQPQRAVYCTTEIDLTQGITERVREFREAVKEAHKEVEKIPKGERLEPWLEAMGRAARKRGIEL